MRGTGLVPLSGDIHSPCLYGVHNTALQGPVRGPDLTRFGGNSPPAGSSPKRRLRRNRLERPCRRRQLLCSTSRRRTLPPLSLVVGDGGSAVNNARARKDRALCWRWVAMQSCNEKADWTVDWGAMQSCNGVPTGVLQGRPGHVLFHFFCLFLFRLVGDLPVLMSPKFATASHSSPSFSKKCPPLAPSVGMF